MEHSKPIYINLLRRDQKHSRQIADGMLFCLLLAILGIGIIFHYYSMKVELRLLQESNSALKTELSGYKAEQSGLQSYKELISKVEAKQKSNAKVRESQIKCVEAYEELEHALPEGLVMTNIEINREEMLMNGYVPDYQKLAAFLSGLRKSSPGQNIILLSSNIDKESGEVMFKLEMGWEAGKK
ncbi:MAG: PilN domain-containing protein [Syntrophomonadaceae bacterium]|nr:PilN domain-containing protein [Syntrophomonadaceae bacterium]MDD3024669.1 PilN domain-containing protein [Syntrophomonadaceae bacterium]